MRRSLASAALALLVAACYETPKPNCAFRCGSAGECPSGYVCSPADDMCHLPQGDTLLECQQGTTPDGSGTVDAPVETPDAPVPKPDAAPGTPDAPVAQPDAPVETPDAPPPRPDADPRFRHHFPM